MRRWFFLRVSGDNRRMLNWNWWAFFAFCVWSAVHLLSAPIYAAVVLSNSGFGTGVSYALHVGAVRKAQMGAAGIQKQKRKAKPKIRREIISYLIKRVKIERVFVSGVISFEDAMHTALVFGAVNALSSIKPVFIQNSAVPDFALGQSNIEITGILSVPAGHIMLAAVKHAAIAMRERMIKWKSTRSKV